MAISLPFSFKPAFDVELDTYDKDGGSVHPSIKFNQKPLTVVSGKVRDLWLVFHTNGHNRLGRRSLLHRQFVCDRP